MQNKICSYCGNIENCWFIDANKKVKEPCRTEPFDFDGYKDGTKNSPRKSSDIR